MTKESILSALFRRQPSLPESAPKAPVFPHAHGTIIQTPYGEAEVTRPLPQKPEVDSSGSSPTMALSIKSWTLADGSHPKIYCTAQTAQYWKDGKTNDPKSPADGILSAFGTLVSSTLTYAGRFSAPKTKGEEQSLPKFDRYYHDSAKVSTAFGHGTILGFRDSDGFYQISLSSWTLANGAHPTAWLRGVDISYQIAKGCREGYPVLTNLGLTGTLESVQPTTGMSFAIFA